MPKRRSLPFDKTGGVIAIQRRLIESQQFQALSPQGKTLMLLMQCHWRNETAVGYGVREAADKIPCARRTAMAAFNELAEAGFIRMVEESLFCSRTKSKCRTWRLTWLPFKDRAPTNEWKGDE